MPLLAILFPLLALLCISLATVYWLQCQDSGNGLEETLWHCASIDANAYFYSKLPFCPPTLLVTLAPEQMTPNRIKAKFTLAVKSMLIFVELHIPPPNEGCLLIENHNGPVTSDKNAIGKLCC